MLPSFQIRRRTTAGATNIPNVNSIGVASTGLPGGHSAFASSRGQAPGQSMATFAQANNSRVNAHWTFNSLGIAPPQDFPGNGYDVGNV